MQYDLKDSFLDAAYELPKEISRKVWKAVRLISRNPESPGLILKSYTAKPMAYGPSASTKSTGWFWFEIGN